MLNPFLVQKGKFPKEMNVSKIRLVFIIVRTHVHSLNKILIDDVRSNLGQTTKLSPVVERQTLLADMLLQLAAIETIPSLLMAFNYSQLNQLHADPIKEI